MGSFPSLLASKVNNQYGVTQANNRKNERVCGNDFSVIALYPYRTTIDGLDLILSYRTARDSFVNFLKSPKCISVSTALKYVEKISNMSNETDYLAWSNEIISSYRKPKDETVISNMVLCSMSSIELTGDIADQSNYKENTWSIIRQYENEIIVLILIYAVPSYLRSFDFQSWCNIKRNTAYKDPRARKPRDGTVSYAPITSTILNQWHETLPPNFERNLPEITPITMDYLLRTKYWLTVLKTVLNRLPVSISIADADSINPGYPLIFVNKKFEEMTGFTLQEIQGKSNKFLQGPDTESESVSQLTNALFNAIPVKVAITNYQKDGTRFKNLLSLSPVFDRNGKYCFVIGVQYDCSAPDATMETLAMADLIISLLPKYCPLWKGITNQS